MFSKACEYAIRAVLFIAKQSKENLRPNIVEIAKAIDSPKAFTAKICQQLVRENLILSRKGPKGGFYLEKNSTITLANIVHVIDGDNIFTGCGLGLQECSVVNPCPLHEQFSEVRQNIRNMLESTQVMQLADKLQKGETFLKFSD